MKRLLILAAILAIWTTSASAEIFVSLIGRTNEGGGIWRWDYGLFLQPTQVMREGDFATIYDFANPIGSATFGLSTDTEVLGRVFIPGITPVPPGLGPTPALSGGVADDPTVPNITVRLDSGGIIIPTFDPDPAHNNPNGPVILGNLSVRTNTDAFKAGVFAAQAADAANPGPLNDYPSTQSNGFAVSVPNAIPEPGSISLLLVGLVALGATGLRRRSTD